MPRERPKKMAKRPKQKTKNKKQYSYLKRLDPSQRSYILISYSKTIQFKATEMFDDFFGIYFKCTSCLLFKISFCKEYFSFLFTKTKQNNNLKKKKKKKSRQEYRSLTQFSWRTRAYLTRFPVDGWQNRRSRKGPGPGALEPVSKAGRALGCHFRSWVR